MSDTPPETPPEPAAEPPPPPPPSAYTGLSSAPVSGAILPVPGNAELAVWFIVELILLIVVISSNAYDMHDWSIATVWLTAAYIISRGIAKASRVLEQ